MFFGLRSLISLERFGFSFVIFVLYKLRWGIIETEGFFVSFSSSQVFFDQLHPGPSNALVAVV